MFRNIFRKNSKKSIDLYQWWIYNYIKDRYIDDGYR